jgi:polysaccharide biosynthesis/export protein
MRIDSRRQYKTWFMAAMAFIFSAAALGCTTLQPAKTPNEMGFAPEPTVLLGPGDIVDIKFFNVSELNETQTVRPDGKIALQLVGEVNVQGKTPAGVREELMRLYTPELRKPEIAVVVRSLSNRRVYVGGEVNRPGLVEMPTRMTALEAILLAGGFDRRRGDISSVVIIRHKDGRRYGCVLDFNDAFKGKEFPSFYLEPLDIVYVPQTKISQVDQWIDQHINLIIPRVGFSYTWPLGAGQVIGITPPTAVVTTP